MTERPRFIFRSVDDPMEIFSQSERESERRTTELVKRDVKIRSFAK